MCWWPIFRKFGTCSTTDALSPRTLLTENICESVQQILQHSPAKKNTKKNKQKTLNSPNMILFFTGPLPVQCGGGQRPGNLADATKDWSTSEDFSPRTVLTKNICRCVHHILKHFPTTMPFLTVSAITYSWMASTAAQADSWWLGRGSWWCLYRGHCRSGPRHLSPRSRVCAPEWHSKDIHSHIHSHTPMHTPKKKKSKNNNSKMLNSPNMMPLLTGPLPVQCAGGRFSGSLAPAPRRTPCRLGHF